MSWAGVTTSNNAATSAVWRDMSPSSAGELACRYLESAALYMSRDADAGAVNARESPIDRTRTLTTASYRITVARPLSDHLSHLREKVEGKCRFWLFSRRPHASPEEHCRESSITRTRRSPSANHNKLLRHADGRPSAECLYSSL